MSWRTPRNAALSCVAVQPLAGGVLFGLISVSDVPPVPMPAARSVWTAFAASSRKS